MSSLVPWNIIPKKTGDIPVAIISLDDAGYRREELIKRGFPPNWVQGYWPATDMRNAPQEEVMQNDAYIKMKRRYGREILPGELGCLFSHRSVINWFSEHSEAALLVVFEDDVIPLDSAFHNKLSALTSFLEKKAISGSSFVCHLGVEIKHWEKSFTRKTYSRELSSNELRLYCHIDKESEVWLGHAYVMSKEAAIRYARSSVCPDFLADDWKRITDQAGISFFSVVPRLFTQSDMASSSIDPSGLRSSSSSSSSSSSVSTLFDKVKIAIRNGELITRTFRSAWCRIKPFLIVFVRNVPSKRNFK